MTTPTPHEETTNKPSGVVVNPTSATASVETFEEVDLHPKLLETVAEHGWKAPTPVQSLCLPHTVSGRDVAGFAQTGTGKTGVFLLTLANRLLKKEEELPPGPQGIVVAPTRELAIQIQHDAQDILGKMGLKSLAVYGGADYEKQKRALKDGVNVVMATPGRLKDFIEKKAVDLSRCEIFVCDEVDRMFDMGFIEDVEFFLDRIPEGAQRLIFSATTNDEVKELAFEYLDNPEYISVNPEVITPENIEQHAIHVEAPHKLQVLLGLMRDHNPTCAIIFTNTKIAAEWLHFKLVRNGIEADLITGDLPQRKRINLIKRIKEGKVTALIATDVASRGLHISRVSHVYNFDLPDEAANYIHRIGRTARAGAKGSSFTFVCDDYGHNLPPINRLLGEELALHSEWFDTKYLEIVDQAGDPFAEREQEARDQEQKDRSPRDRSRSGPRQKRDGRDDGKRRGRQGAKARDHEGGRKKEGGGQRKRDAQSKDRNRKDQQRRRKPKQKQSDSTQQAPQPAAKDQSVGGILKKIAKLFLGKK